MRVAILSGSRTLYSTRRLVQACRRQGCQASVFDPVDLLLLLDRWPTLCHRAGNRRLGQVALGLPRIGTLLADYGLAVIRHLEAEGVPMVNRADAISLAQDKMRCLQELSRHGIRIPRTAMIRHPRQLTTALDRVGGPPVVLKLAQGSQGIGVILLETVDAVESVLDTLWSLGQVILIQEFVGECRGRDLRVLVVGGRVLAAMRRQARVGEFRSNIHRGGTGTVVHLEREYRRTAVEAARVIGLDVAGVDMLETSDGPTVLEMNSSPGFEGLEAATGIDVAGEIVRHGLSLVEGIPGAGAIA